MKKEPSLSTPDKHSANNHISRFYVDDFQQVTSRVDLNDYLKTMRMEKWQNQDEHGNQHEYSRNGGIVHVTEMQIKQLRTYEADDFYSSWSKMANNFTTGWSVTTQGDNGTAPWHHVEHEFGGGQVFRVDIKSKLVT